MNAAIAYTIVALSMCLAVQSSAEAPDAEGQIMARSLVSMGDTARLQHVLAKARRGEQVVVAVIGGSITEGARASRPEYRWGNVVAKWWEQTFPKTPIKFVNAGIGATGSNIGAHRAQMHLLKHKPDFVAAEYSVNDPNSEFAAETLEGLTRQVLGLPNRPAMMLLFTMNRAGGNAQEWHSKIGRHYKLPMVSFRDALWPEIEADRMKWEDVEGDEIHPNDRGHKYCGDFVTAVVDKVRRELPADAELPAIAPLPAPLISDVFERATVLDAKTLAPTVSEGWQPADSRFGTGWVAEEPGSVLQFEVTGTAISLIYYRIKGPTGVAQAQLDDGAPVKMNAWFNADWGGYSAYQLLARDLPQGKHRVRIELLQEKAEASEGHRFHVHAVLAAGIPAQDREETE